MLLLAAAYGALVGNRWYWAGSLLILLAWIAALGGRGYRSARMSIAGLDQIAAGMACLLAGLLVSLWKLGVPQGWIDRWLKPPPVAQSSAAKQRRTERSRRNGQATSLRRSAC